MFSERTNSEDQISVLRVMLHTADVSNVSIRLILILIHAYSNPLPLQPAKTMNLYRVWIDRITEEFFLQGDQERSLSMTVSAMNDREKPIPEAKFQLGFVNFIVKPLYESVAKVPG
jgi:hypothetical protein